MTETDPSPSPFASCCGCGSAASGGRIKAGGPDPVILPWWRLGVALIIAGQSMVFGIGINLEPPDFGSTGYIVLHSLLAGSALLVLLLLGPALFFNWLRNLWQRKVSVEGLFALSAIGALVASFVCTFTGTGDVYYEVVAVVLVIYTVGKKLGEESRRRVLGSVDQWGTAFARARALSCCGKETWRPVSELTEGDNVVVRPGEAIAVDGVIKEGHSYVLETALTGETEPVAKGPQELVRAGSFAVDGALTIELNRSGTEREIDSFLAELKASPPTGPSPFEEESAHTLRWFVPAVVAVALATFLGWTYFAGWETGLFNSMAVLLVACPCAFGLATPLAIWTGLQRLFRLGITTRSPGLLHALASSRHIFLDKTGTLTGETFQDVSLELAGNCPLSRPKLIRLLAQVERDNPHPLAQSLLQLAEVEKAKQAEDFKIPSLRLIPGRGLQASVLLPGEAITYDLVLEAEAVAGKRKKVTRVIWNGELIAFIYYYESPLKDSLSVLGQLKELNLKVTLLSGDPQPDYSLWGEFELQGNLKPEQKAAIIEKSRQSNEFPVMVGDAANDAAAFLQSAGSLALRRKSSLAQETAQGIIAGESLASLPLAIKTARVVSRGLHQNRQFSLTYNAAGIALAVAGILHPVVAALLMLGSSAFVSWRAWHCAEIGQNLSERDLALTADSPIIVET